MKIAVPNKKDIKLKAGDVVTSTGTNTVYIATYLLNESKDCVLLDVRTGCYGNGRFKDMPALQKSLEKESKWKIYSQDDYYLELKMKNGGN